MPTPRYLTPEHRTISITVISAGQPRPYADSERVYLVDFDLVPTAPSYIRDLTEEDMTGIAVHMLCPGTLSKDEYVHEMGYRYYEVSFPYDQAVSLKVVDHYID